MGDLSLNFNRSEFTCKHCGRIVGPPAAFVTALQRLRTMRGQPLVIVDGYRCPTYNAKVGGTRNSQHLTGNAVDLPAGYCTPDQAHAAGIHGVGVRGAGRVVHIDGGPYTGTFND